MTDKTNNPARILIVDDDREMCALLSDLLIESGHEVIAAHSGEDALSRLEQDSFNLMVSDIRMPGLKGLDLLSCTKEQNPALPVIMITAFGSIESRPLPSPKDVEEGTRK